MADTKEVTFKGEVIKVTNKKGFWKLRYADGTEKKLFHHFNEEGGAIWMWESGRIDEESLIIGKLIDRSE